MGSIKYLDSKGLSYLWQKIKSEITDNFECEKVLFETESITLQPNKFYYNPNAISSLDISLDFEEGVANTYFVEFGGNNISLLLPSYIRWENDVIPDFSKSDYKYTVKIQDDVAYLIDKILDESLKQYFYIESRENSNTIDLGSSTWIGKKSYIMEYSIDKMNWYPLNMTSYTLNEGEKMYFRCIGGNIEKNSSAIGVGYPLLNPSKTFNVGGDISTVIYGKENVQTINNSYAMCYLFSQTKVVEASNLLLPATTLTDYCYEQMFCGCTSLTTAPEILPATTLAYKCYQSMFSDCTSLIAAPELLATTLADWCYSYMFFNCTSLTTAPESLPVMKLTPHCYSSMFAGCTSLTTIPEILPATTLTDYCYHYMFSNCTSLTTAPELPATTLAESCYDNMFQGCTSLTTIPEILPATTLTTNCYNNMFQGCTSLKTAPELPATTLAESCYSFMFYGCTSLTAAPELPATTLAGSCYYYMFTGCTSLTTAPELPATTLASRCYGYMFWKCTKLNYIKCLIINPSGFNGTDNWVSGVSSTGTFIKHPNATWSTGTSGIPSGWTRVDAEI